MRQQLHAAVVECKCLVVAVAIISPSDLLNIARCKMDEGTKCPKPHDDLKGIVVGLHFTVKAWHRRMTGQLIWQDMYVGLLTTFALHRRDTGAKAFGSSMPDMHAFQLRQETPETRLSDLETSSPCDKNILCHTWHYFQKDQKQKKVGLTRAQDRLSHCGSLCQLFAPYNPCHCLIMSPTVY